MEAKQATTDEAQFECKHCGAEHDELEATECDESPMGFCSLQHKDPRDAKSPDTYTMNKSNTEATDEETDDWKTMSADECKKQAGLTQVDGLVWEQADEENEGGNTNDHWNPNGSECPACGDGGAQEVIARPADNTDVEMSLPDRVVECGACGVEWED